MGSNWTCMLLLRREVVVCSRVHEIFICILCTSASWMLSAIPSCFDGIVNHISYSLVAVVPMNALFSKWCWCHSHILISCVHWIVIISCKKLRNWKLQTWDVLQWQNVCIKFLQNLSRNFQVNIDRCRDGIIVDFCFFNACCRNNAY